MALNYQAPITTGTGYGITSTNIIKALDKLGVDIHLFPIGDATIDNKADQQLIERIFANTLPNWSQNSPTLKVWHPHDLASRIGKGKYGALVFFELDTLKPVEKSMLRNVDTVFVASKWAKKVLEDNGIQQKIVVSPLAVDTNVFKDYGNKNVFGTETYKFINIGKWEIRKGHDIIHALFNQAFNQDDNVELWVMAHNPFISEEEEKE